MGGGGGGGGLSQYMEGSLGVGWGGLKMPFKNTCEGVHLIVKLLALILNFFRHIFQGF